MPFTANRQFKQAPRMLARAEGMYFWTPEGRKVLDGIAGLWCVNAGHASPKIVQAIQAQAAEMDFAPPFNMGHPKAFELAERLVEILPAGVNKVFYTNSGSESVETALKMAIAYHRARGDGARTRLIGRERGYHGVNFGGISVGGIVANRKMFGTLLAGVDHIRHTHDPARNAFTRGVPEYGAEFADDLERLVALHDASTIAAVIVEPVAGSTGVVLPPKGYLERLRAICDRHGILLIFDEVITGFGRLGSPFAATHFGVTPDLMTVAKGLTNGAVPMGAVFAKQHIHDTFMNGPEHLIEFFHGYTYSAHPLACAAALGALDTYVESGLLTRGAQMAP
ncbi:MAG TPA: aminotransferase class III-fold pyridoxal phosphate-dependent enzyme, partial [Burkholderiaceae bacterium]|nr:aminotransferase class III-fold pyridoxal phosphate-dependent enzyme [Burkholderiaceae bacterium]